MSLESKLGDLDGLLAELAAKHGVPGAALAVMQGDEVVEAAAGVVNVNTGVETTTDSVFQIGSITKTFTTTQVMQLVDEGRIELDAPILGYLPEFQLADAEATAAITIRQLLTHTSGLDGDFFEDTGRGDDCVERYVTAMRALPQIHPPGDLFSYCNAGFALLGRLIEKQRGLPWDQALRRELLVRIGTEKMGCQPEEAILHRAAAGHIPHRDTGEPFVVPVWRLNPSNGPAGATPFATARDLLRFARLHLDEGRAPDGSAVISPASASAMRERQVVPPRALADAWGLGFQIFDWGTEVIGHDGGTIGQASFLRILPEHDLALSMLTNGGEVGSLYRDVFGFVLAEVAGVEIPPLLAPDPNAKLGDLACYAGSYGRISMRVDVSVRDGALHFLSRGIRGWFRALPPTAGALAPVDEETFVLVLPNGQPMPVTFLEPDVQGRPRYVHAGGRANRRLADL